MAKPHTTATRSACTIWPSAPAPVGASTERARWLERNGAEIESGPSAYDYTPGYYAVFFYDPDGIKLEIVRRSKLRTVLR